MAKTKYSWVPFYEELAEKLLTFKSNRARLIEKVKEAHQMMGLNMPKIEKDNNNIPDIDPFTVIALFNRGKQSVASRQKICEGYKNVFGITNSVPSDYDGVPMYFYNQYCFYRYVGDPKRDDTCFDYFWNLFEQAISYSKDQSNKSAFETAFEQVMRISLVGQPKLTIGLFHIRPNVFVNLDSNNNALIEKELHRTVGTLTGAEYLDLCSSIVEYTKTQLNGSLPDFSGRAYELKQQTVAAKTNEWEPTLEQYNPMLTKADWLRFMRESGKFSDNYKFLLAAMYDIGGQASCMQLELKYRKSSSSFNLTATHFAEHVQEFTQCPIRIDEDGKERYWSIPFVGRNTTEQEEGSFVWKLRPELKEAIEEYGLTTYLQGQNAPTTEKENVAAMIPKNTILYGPPGTGKTYNSAIYAVAIIEGKDIEEVRTEPYSDVMNRYNEYKEQGQIEFTTFHQSYGYEEFIEGIRPTMDENSEDDGDIEYQITSGLFKSFCERASRPVLKKNVDIGLNANPTVWKVSLEGTGDNPTRTECMANNHIRIGYDSYGEVITDETEVTDGKTVLNAFISRMKIGDIVFSCYSSTTIDAIGVVTGEYEWHDEYEKYKRLRKVNWLVKGIKEDITGINAGKTLTLSSTYALNNITLGDVMALLERVAPDATMIEDKRQNYVFIIDEINRGNISKIFGELITLIEPSKRLGQTEGMTAKLPYSQKSFGVPDNIYILGTMNTADRSIATLDTALRRRFRFKEMQPDPSTLTGIAVDGLNISTMLSRMNKKIAILYDREHAIGHAYFMPLKNNPSVESLASIFADNIIPLLQEYFYEDYEKIRLVLGDNQKDNEEIQFIIARANDYADLFGDGGTDFDESITYEINSRAFKNIESYKSI